LALHRVEKNRGSAGIDQMRAGELRGYLKEHWPKIKAKLLEGSYQPQAVKRAEIVKPTGGMRQLGIPTVVDRLIQQALAFRPQRLNASAPVLISSRIVSLSVAELFAAPVSSFFHCRNDQAVVPIYIIPR
jgi:hypothetical protein